MSDLYLSNQMQCRQSASCFWERSFNVSYYKLSLFLIWKERESFCFKINFNLLNESFLITPHISETDLFCVDIFIYSDNINLLYRYYYEQFFIAHLCCMFIVSFFYYYYY